MPNAGTFNAVPYGELGYSSDGLGNMDGRVFEISTYNTALASGAVIDSVLITGVNPIAVLSRGIQIDNLGIKVEVFLGPTYTGGTDVPIYSLNKLSSRAPTFSIKTGVTVTTTGTKCFADRIVIGDSSGGQARSHTGATDALDASPIYANLKTYLIRTTNLAAAAQKVATHTVLLEGENMTEYL